MAGVGSRQVRVMLVQHDARLRSLVADALNEENLELAGVEGAEDALILLGANPLPDMLVTEADLGMGPSGADLAQVAREHRPDIEVAVIGDCPLGRCAPVCGAQLVSALQSVVARNVAPLDPAVLSVTGLGAAYNVIPGRVSLCGTTRAFRAETLRLMEERARALATGIAAGFGATAEAEFREVCLPLVNTLAETATIADAAAGLVGQENVDRHYPAIMASEDFSYMLAARPGAFLFLGNRAGETGACEVHNPGYDFNDAAIPYGAGVLAAVVERELWRRPVQMNGAAP